MKVPFYLIVSSSGAIRVNKKAPTLGWKEVSIGMNLDIPDEIFERPILQASISIPKDAVSQSPINADVQENVSKAIEQATGLKFSIKVEEDVIDKLARDIDE